MDALSETLRVVQLVGAIFINARFTAPWCYQSPSADSAAPLLEPGAERVVIFHLITEGECYVELGKEPPLRLIAGDVVVFPEGDASHELSTRAAGCRWRAPGCRVVPPSAPVGLWLAGVRDRIVGAALNSLHKHPNGACCLRPISCAAATPR